MSEQVQRMIGLRIRLARTALEYTQEMLSQMVGFKDRQILSNIESGRRGVKADELVQFAEALKRPLEYFTDTFSLAGEVAFSWRARQAEPELLDEFEEKAGRWLAVFRRIVEQKGETASPLVQYLNLNKNSSLEEAAQAGEALAQDWAMGETPSFRLKEEAERRLGLLVLMIDAPRAISGAACRLPEFNAILVNRQDPAGRRNYDFAHELFHLLTWERLRPRRKDFEDAAPSGKDKRIECMADNFAAGVLMPRKSLESRWEAHQDKGINERLIEVAREMGVTAQAARYRAQNLGWLTAQDKVEIDDRRLVGAGPRGDMPPLYSKVFVEKLDWALSTGRLSVRRAAQLLSQTPDELCELFAAYGREAPFEI